MSNPTRPSRPSSRPLALENLESRRLMTLSVTGTVFNDVNGDGHHQPSESGLANYPVRADTNGNGTIDSGDQTVQTDAHGVYTFYVPGKSGKLIVAPAASPGYILTAGNFGTRQAILNPSNTDPIDLGDFIGATQKSLIVGQVVGDTDGNGVTNGDETGVAGQIVYADTNLNGKRDGTEPYALTRAFGDYQLGVDFPESGTATYSVRVDADGTEQIEPATAAVSVTVGAHQSVTAPDSFVIPPPAPDAQLSVEATTALNHSESDVTVTSTNVGRTLALSASPLTALVKGTVEWDAHYVFGQPFVAEATGADYTFVDDASQHGAPIVLVAERLHTADGYGPVRFIRIDLRPPTGVISGYTFNDINGDGKVSDNEYGSSGKSVYLDLNDNNKPDKGEPTSITDGGGAFKFTGLYDGEYFVRRVFPAGYKQSTPDLDIAIINARTVSNLLIGSTLTAPPPVQGAITGYTFDDTNKDGLYTAGEAKTSGKVVFLDTNNNGKLDTGETSVKTAADGSFSFTGLAVGTYHLRRVYPAGYVTSTPLFDVVVSANRPTSGDYPIGSKSDVVVPPPVTGTASLAGMLFNDNNDNAKYDSGDRATNNARVFLDTNDNGVLDTGEVSVLTDGAGKFLLQALAAGTYHVRRVFASGESYSTPLADVTVNAGQAKTGLVIGTKRA